DQRSIQGPGPSVFDDGLWPDTTTAAPAGPTKSGPVNELTPCGVLPQGVVLFTPRLSRSGRGPKGRGPISGGLGQSGRRTGPIPPEKRPSQLRKKWRGSICGRDRDWLLWLR